MSNPHRERVNAALEAALRPFAEEAIPSADVDLLTLIKKVVTDAGLVRVERLSGPLPPNATGIVQETSVAVSHPAFSTTASLATLLDQIIAGLLNEVAEHLVGGTQGDLIVYDASGNGSRLPIGSAGQELTVVSGMAAWSTPAAYTDEQAQDAVGNALVDGTGIDFTYNDGANTITAEPIFAGTGSAGTVAHSDHTHSGGVTLPIAESDVTNLPTDLATLTTNVAAKMTNPMTTQDDLIVGGASGAAARLGKGSDGQVLTVDPTTHHLVWATPSAGFTDPTTTKGDLIVHGASTTRIAVGSDGQVLTADSTQAAGVKWAAASGGGGVIPGWITGRYYSMLEALPWSFAGAASMVANRLYAFPVNVPASLTADRIGVYVSTAATGKLVRLMIHAAGGIPGALILDAGTVSVGATGATEITISQSLAAGWYWLSVVSDGAPSLFGLAGNSGPNVTGQTAMNGGDKQAGWQHDIGATTAPNPWPALSGSSAIGTGPLVFLRAS